MIRLRTPTATVGRPWPSTPLTKPASTKANAREGEDANLKSGMSDLQRLAAHQARLCEAGSTPSRITAQRKGRVRSSRGCSPKPRAPCTGRKSDGRHAIEHLHRHRAAFARRFGASGCIAPAVRASRRRRLAPRLDYQFADGRGIAQTEVEALRADGGSHARLRRRARCGSRETVGGFDGERKEAMAVFDRHFAEDRMCAALDLADERGSSSSPS